MLQQAAIIMSGIGVLVTGLLALAFLRDPVRGLQQTTHHHANLPEVMTDRYFAMTFLAIGATIYQDMVVIAWLFAAFAFMGFYDAWIYRKAGQSTVQHLGAGVAALLVVIVALVAWQTGAAA